MGSSAVVHSRVAGGRDAPMQVSTKGTREHSTLLQQLELLGHEKLNMQERRSLLELIERMEVKLNSVKVTQTNSAEEGQPQVTSDWRKHLSELGEVRKEKEKMVNSLSEVAGSRLKDNNPGIADLSDTNRPSKLAEKYSELYDNEWTDLMEVVTNLVKGRMCSPEEKEKQSVQFMVDMLLEAYEWCKTTAEGQYESIMNAVLMKDTSQRADKSEQEFDLLQEKFVTKKCKDFQKIQMSKPEGLSQVKKCVHEEVKQIRNHHDLLQAAQTTNAYKVYVDMCAELCWYMRIQDPPIHMVTENISNTEASKHYRPYTKSGEELDYIVWPALKLHENGSLLYKGIAQFKPALHFV